MRKSPLLLLLLLVSCSTTSRLPEGRYLLSSSKVSVRGDDGPRASEVSSYMRQQPNSSIFGWNPFVGVYNWSDGSGRGINSFWEKIGTAPVVFDPVQMQSSASAMRTRLVYLGY